MPGPVGNTNATKNRIWRDAIRRQLIQFEDAELGIARGQAIHKMAEEVLRKALKGDEFAIREIGNRTDGKPVQVQEIEVDITASFVVKALAARVGLEAARATLLTVAPNLLPILDQLTTEQGTTIEHQP